MKEQTHLKEWHISNTLIQIIPKYIELFQAMRILDLPKNQISRLPAEIGMFLSWNLQGPCLGSRGHGELFLLLLPQDVAVRGRFMSLQSCWFTVSPLGSDGRISLRNSAVLTSATSLEMASLMIEQRCV